jgi:hypothetical protein
MRTPAFKECRASASRSAWFADQDASKDVARPRIERLEARAEVGVVIHRHPFRVAIKRTPSQEEHGRDREPDRFGRSGIRATATIAIATVRYCARSG